MDETLIEKMTNDIMNALTVSVPVVDNPLIELPWWATTPPEDLYVHKQRITGGADVSNAVAMGLTVPQEVQTSNLLFVSPSEHREGFRTHNILTAAGYRRYADEAVGKIGWPMLKLFCGFAQASQHQLSPDTRERLIKFLDERFVDQMESMLFKDFNRKKRWRHGEKTHQKLRNRWIENAETFKRLATPLVDLGSGEYAGQIDEYGRQIFDVLTKVKQDVFEQSGELCNYNRSAHKTKYQNDKKKGEGVISPELNNAWALFLTASLKLRVTIWSRTEVLNNDEIIKDLWANDLVDNPDLIKQFDQVLMCRPANGILRAVRKNIPNNWGSNWSKLVLVDRDVIPGDYQSQVQEAQSTAHHPSEEDEETESIDDEQPHVMWKKPQEIQNAFEVTIGPGEIIRFLDNISGQLRFHIRDRIYFNTSTHARVAIKVADSQIQQLSIYITDFASRVTKHQYWDDPYVPTGYEIMPQMRSTRVHVVWFLPRHVTSHLRSFLQVDLNIDPKSMKGSFYVTHVTENRQVLHRDETYRVITLKNVTEFAIISDYMFLRTDRPDKPKKEIKMLKFKIQHPALTGSMSDANFQQVVSAQTDRIIEALSTFAKRTNCSVPEFDTETIDSNAYIFNSNSKKRMRLTINVQYDGPYTEISLEQLSI